jgi:threonine synthase
MKFISTRNKNIQTSLSEAIRSGIPNGGGLYVPECLPKIQLDLFSADKAYSEFAALVLKDFFTEDILSDQLPTLCQEAFNFPVPLKKINDNTFILELFHGPTLSFKDFGARFLAEIFNAFSTAQKITILVATSGDTGSAVASAFYKKNINVIIFYPAGKISPRQEHQITCFGENILTLAVNGNFDDCQHLVKTAFDDVWFQDHMALSTANSINIGRLLPQITYYAYSSVKFFHQYQTQAGFIIPSGNLGNITAAYWAKVMGFPIREIVMATNANRVISDYLESGEYHPCASIKTLANAMDVGDPSNFERLSDLFKTFEVFKNNVQAFSVSDDEIKSTIRSFYQKNHTILCPHTATACFVREKLSQDPWIVVATADPCKFETVIEPLLDQKIEPSAQLKWMLSRPVYQLNVSNNINEIKKIITPIFKNI